LFVCLFVCMYVDTPCAPAFVCVNTRTLVFECADFSYELKGNKVVHHASTNNSLKKTAFNQMHKHNHNESQIQQVLYK